MLIEGKSDVFLRNVDRVMYCWDLTAGRVGRDLKTANRELGKTLLLSELSQGPRSKISKYDSEIRVPGYRNKVSGQSGSECG